MKTEFYTMVNNDGDQIAIISKKVENLEPFKKKIVKALKDHNTATKVIIERFDWNARSMKFDVIARIIDNANTDEEFVEYLTLTPTTVY